MALPIPSISCSASKQLTLVCKEEKALAFDWVKCCHLALCSWQILFHYETLCHLHLGWGNLNSREYYVKGNAQYSWPPRQLTCYCFVTIVNKIFSVKSSLSKLVCKRRWTVLSLPLWQGFYANRNEPICAMLHKKTSNTTRLCFSSGKFEGALHTVEKHWFYCCDHNISLSYDLSTRNSENRMSYIKKLLGSLDRK
jgi:hypothetical protein